MPVQTKTPNFSSGIDHTYELQENYMQDGLPAFQFRKRTGEINWRKICALDVDRIARELDFITLQEYISTVTFCNIATVPDVDCQIAKLFKLAQFTIEYLLHSQEYLQSVLNEYEAKVEQNEKENGSLQHKIQELEADIIKLKEENKKRRKMIQQQQMLIEAGASSYYQCPHCEKAFMNASFLQAHMQRRHPGCVNYIGDVIAHSQNEQARLGNQLKQLEQDLKSERETFNAKLLKAEQEKKEWTEKSQREMNEWKEEEGARMKKQLDAMQQSFLEEVDMLKKKEETYQGQIADLKATMDQRQSNLGDLVDDLEGEKQRLREYENKMHKLERLNEMKDNQIAELSNTVKGMWGDSEMREEQERRLREQEKRVRDLQSQLTRKPSMMRAAHLQDEVDTSEGSDESVGGYIEERMRGLYEEERMRGLYEEERMRRLRQSEIQSLKPQMINHLKSLLQEKLRSSGVDPDAPGISSATLSRKLIVLKTERQQTAKEIPDYYQIRESTRRTLVEEAGRLSRSSRASKRRPERDNVPSRNVSATSPGSKRRSVAPHESSRSRNISFAGNIRSSSTPLKRTPEVAKKNSIVTPTPVPRGGQKKQSSSPVLSDDGDFSDWDDVSEIRSDDGDIGKQQAKRPHVKDLKTKLEQDLSKPKKKPPPGAVQVFPPNETAVQEFRVSDDDDLFSITSSENEDRKDGHRPGSSRAPLGGGVRKSVTSNSSNTQGTSVWGSGQKPKMDVEIEDFDLDEVIDDLRT